MCLGSKLCNNLAAVALMVSDFSGTARGIGADVYANAHMAGNVMVLDYTMYNIGTTEISSIDITVRCFKKAEVSDGILQPGASVSVVPIIYNRS